MKYLLYILLLSYPMASMAQNRAQESKMVKDLRKFFAKYKPKDQVLTQAPQMLDYKLDNKSQKITITADEFFAAQEFSPELNADIYKRIRKELPKPYRKYEITIVTNGMSIDALIPNRLSKDIDKSRMWGDVEYDGNPWTQNLSYPAKTTHGLNNRHVSLWASHGRYYDVNRGTWKWQRPKLFGTTEDLFTQTIVVPYLIPMLENAGAVVFTPRERDWQKHELIVDNDDKASGTSYIEVYAKHEWTDAGTKGFASHRGTYKDGENPFEAGTARMAKTTSKKNNYSLISYMPKFPEEGRYAVYVSYSTLENSVDDASYTVWHKGEKTEFRVNQQMGGGTWVYLGTFDFDKGSSQYNRVILTNRSARHNGVVTADAVRFGGGMGNIERGGLTSGLPRCLEGARYYAQWAGMPYKVYSSKNGTDDYGDDINTRSLMTNHLAGGSCYVPSQAGLNVPIELSLAVHSDAGYSKDGTGLIGSLGICTTGFNNGHFNTGMSRMASRDFADALLSNAARDIIYKYGKWNKRELFDRNYSETRIPEVPSAIIETMSHQNFPDMMYGQDPNFRFTLARSLYKTILRYVNDQHGRQSVVTPLTPDNFHIEFTDVDEVRLNWRAVNDPQEATSKPTGYIVYTSTGSTGFDNGTYIRADNSHRIKLEPGVLYSFRVAAVNAGGCSFPSEVLCALYNPGATKDILIVDGFHRLSSPAVRNTQFEQGFDIDEDPGVTLGPTAGWVGRQLCYDTGSMGIDGEDGLGWSADDMTGIFVAGNDRNHVRTHAEAIKEAGRYNIISCSSEAIENGKVDLAHYQLADIVLGLERNDTHSLEYYKTFTPAMRERLEAYVSRGGSLLVSGAYTGSDMTSPDEQSFLANVLKCRFGGRNRTSGGLAEGLGTTIQFYNTINEKHYAATSADVLNPIPPAYAAMRYSDGPNACVAYKGDDYRVITTGFPLECIRSKQKQTSIIKGLINFLLK